MSYVFDAKRYDRAQFRRCGLSGIVLPPVSLGRGRTSVGSMFSRLGGQDPASVRSRCDPFRLGEQLWATVRVGRGELRVDSAKGFSRLQK